MSTILLLIGYLLIFAGGFWSGATVVGIRISKVLSKDEATQLLNKIKL